MDKNTSITQVFSYVCLVQLRPTAEQIFFIVIKYIYKVISVVTNLFRHLLKPICSILNKLKILYLY